jgi:tetratricopeptide (TPR) repeat protein
LFQTYLIKAREYENEGNLSEAHKQYKLALTVKPEDPAAKLKSTQIEKTLIASAEDHYQAGLTYYHQGRYDLAKGEFLSALRLWPEHMGAKQMLTSEDTPAKLKEYIIHTIKPGESISKLAIMYYGDYKKFPIIAKYNNMGNATKVIPGQRIKIPKIEGMPLLEVNQEDKQAILKDDIIHTVKPGETVSKLALIYYGDYKKFPIITKYNNMDNATLIKPGQKIKIPKIEGVPLLEDNQVAMATTPEPSVQISSDEETKKELDNGLFFDEDPASLVVYQEEETVEDIEEIEDETQLAALDQTANYRELGIEFFKKKQYPEAIAEFVKVVNVNPNDEISIKHLSLSHFQQGMFLYGNKEYLQAKEEFEASLRYDEDCKKCSDYIEKSEEIYKEIHYKKGISYFGNEQLSEAIMEWELVHKIDPNYENVDSNLEKAKALLKRLEQIKKIQSQPQTENSTGQ